MKPDRMRLLVFLLSPVLLSAAGCATPSSGGATGSSARQPGYAEPKIPPACVTLVATKGAHDGFLDAADEATDDTRRIQDAIRSCPYGQAVRLKADGVRNAFLSRPLDMVSGVTLWIDAETTLFASRNPRDFDAEPGACGTDEFDDSNGCRSLINVNDVDDVGVVGEGTIDGRGGEPMIGGSATWWDVAQHAKKISAKHSNPRLIEVKKSRNFTLYKVKIYDSPKFHVTIGARGFVVWGITVITPVRPRNSVGRALGPNYARNTDGVDPSGASNGVIAYNYISVGDDQIAIKAGSGAPTEYVTIAHNRFGSGHGMSIGSETNSGVNNILVYDLAIDGHVDSGAMPNVDLNGIRIKSDSSRGGVVDRIRYRDVCIRDLVNPILISPRYSKATGGMIPDYRDIVLENVRAFRTPGATLTPTVVQIRGYDADHIMRLTLDNVVVEDPSALSIKAEFADVKIGPGGSNIRPAGDKVTVTGGSERPVAPNSCADKFGPLPWLSPAASSASRAPVLSPVPLVPAPSPAPGASPPAGASNGPSGT